MYFIKSFLSKVLTIVLLFATTCLFLITFIRGFVTQQNLRAILTESDAYDLFIDENNFLNNNGIPQEMIRYVNLDEVMTDYIVNKIYYAITKEESQPTLDIEVLNDCLSRGFQAYLDEQRPNHINDLDSYLEQKGFNQTFRSKALTYVKSHDDISIKSNEIINNQSLEKITGEVDDAINKVYDRSYVMDAFSFIYNSKYLIMMAAIIILSLILIALINFNIIAMFTHAAVSFGLETIIFAILYLLSTNINFSGNAYAAILNAMLPKIAQHILLYLIINFVITVACIILWRITKHLNIFISHKRGVATLDTIFDDYDNDEVVEEISKNHDDNKTDNLEKKAEKEEQGETDIKPRKRNRKSSKQ